jgi:hypothetical protein
MQFLAALGQKKTAGGASKNHKDIVGRMALVGNHGLRQEALLPGDGEDRINFTSLKILQERCSEPAYECGQLRSGHAFDSYCPTLVCGEAIIGIKQQPIKQLLAAACFATSVPAPSSCGSSQAAVTC